jgi:hypothetical protein
MDKIGASKTQAFILILLIILILIVIIVGFLIWMVFGGKNYDSVYEDRISSGELVNPAKDLSLEEIEEQFDEDFVYFMLYQIGAYNLHTPPLSSEKPAIEIIVENTVYNAQIEKGEIYVDEGEIEEYDISIQTSSEEAAKIINDGDYIQESFENGESTIELVASETTLASKGYLKLYSEITGDGISGAAIFNF